MPDEITLTASLTASKEGVSLSSWPTTTFAEDWTDEDFVEGTQTIGTTHEAVDIPAEVATLGWSIFYNPDPTNYCELGTQSGTVFTAFCRVPPLSIAGPMYLSMGRTELYAKANSSSVTLHKRILRA